MKIAELAEMWLESRRNYVKVSTFSLYSYELKNYICKKYGSIDIKKVSENLLQTMILNWKANLANSTIRNIMILLKQIIEFAVRNGFIKKLNFKLEMKKNDLFKKTRIKTYTHKEQKKIITYYRRKCEFQESGIDAWNL